MRAKAFINWYVNVRSHFICKSPKPEITQNAPSTRTQINNSGVSIQQTTAHKLKGVYATVW